jgi:hypothetical protein
MIAAFIYVGGMLAMLVLLIVLVHRAILAEDAAYAAGYHEVPAVPTETPRFRTEERRAA